MAIIRWKTGVTPEAWAGRAVYWYDGDTLYVNGGAVRGVVRIWGIDAPEWGQTGCGEARAALRNITRNGPVVVTPIGIDRYGRIVAKIGAYACLDVGLYLLLQGLVWWEWRYAWRARDYQAAQAGARAAKRGLWVPGARNWAPWLWRRRRRQGL